MSSRAAALLLAALTAPAAAVDAADEAETDSGAGLSLELPAPSGPGVGGGTARPTKPAPAPRRLRPAAPRTEITLDDAVDMPSDL